LSSITHYADGNWLRASLLPSIIISVIYLLDLVLVKSLLTTSLLFHKWNNKLFSYINHALHRTCLGKRNLPPSNIPLENIPPTSVLHRSAFFEAVCLLTPTSIKPKGASLKTMNHRMFLFLVLLTSSTSFVLSQQPPIPISIINLERDSTRWNRVDAEFTKKKVPRGQIQRLEAVYGKDLSKEDLEANASLAARLFCTLGTIGCYLSHRKFWEMVADGDSPYQIVFEDDVVLVENFYEQAQAMVQELEDHEDTKDQWDVLLLGGLGCVNPDPREYGPYNIPAFFSGGCRTPRLVTEHCHVPKRPFGTHAYVLSQRGAKKLLKLAWKAAYHVDCVIWGMEELNLYICDPLLVYQDSSPSTVGAITSGIETWIPSSIKMDNYTQMSLEWVWNEPVIRIPVFDVVITQGRYLIYGILGSILGVHQLGKRPWILPAHVAVYVTFMATFNRLISRPVAR
jgi:GR25 family glycosyltransferase involved in LPS biosynthesis